MYTACTFIVYNKKGGIRVYESFYSRSRAVARHGKDHLAERLRDELGLNFVSSSYFCCELFIYDKLKDAFGYRSIKECYADRHTDQNRKLWYDLICEFNKDDPARLSRAIFNKYDMYVGNRNILEVVAAQKEMDCFTIWVNAAERCEPESEDSCTVTQEQADIVIYNNGTVEEFDRKITNLCKYIRSMQCNDHF